VKVAELKIQKKIEESIAYMWNALQLNVPQLMIIFIVIGKRHYIQFSCPNKMKIDQETVPWILWQIRVSQIQLLSCAGILGTNHPAHYIILKDDNLNFALKMVQELVWNLCHVYAKANKSTSHSPTHP
jgi:hypothetical protein